MKKTLLISLLLPVSFVFAGTIPNNNKEIISETSNISFTLSSSKEIKSDLTIINISNDNVANTIPKTLAKTEKDQLFMKNILDKYPTVKIINSNVQILTNYDRGGEINDYTGNISYSLSDKNIRSLNNLMIDIKDKDWKIVNIKYLASDELKDSTEIDLIKNLNDKLKKRISLIKTDNGFNSCRIKDLNINRQSEEYPMPMMFKSMNSNSVAGSNEAISDNSGLINNNVINKISMTFSATIGCK